MFKVRPSLIARSKIKNGDVVVRVYENYCRSAKTKSDGWEYLLGVAIKDCRKGQKCRIVYAEGLNSCFEVDVVTT